MGREWLYWGGGGRMARTSAGNGRMSADMKEAEGDTSAGCMCAVFQLFDLHPFPLNQQRPSKFLPADLEEAQSSKGVEAPRNSLKLDEPAGLKEEENLSFPAGINQIKTRVSARASESGTEDFSSECCSPGTRTPNLVARLMGLDLLPECSSPSFPSSNSRLQAKSQFNHQEKDRYLLQIRSSKKRISDDIGVGARSLPDTPRISSARRSDVDRHRLSLQVNKENIMKDEFVLSGKNEGRRGRFGQDENRSPGHYARQIVRQVKERVSRRVGLDITNIDRDKGEIRRDENLILLKPNSKNSKAMSRMEDESGPDGKPSATPSCSPKLRFLDTSKNKQVTNSSTKSPKLSDNGTSNPIKPGHQAIMQEEDHQHREFTKVGSADTCSTVKKVPHITSDHAIRRKEEKPFVRSAATNEVNFTDKKSKKAPLSSQLLSISGPALLLVKKDPSPSATKLPQKQKPKKAPLSSELLNISGPVLLPVKKDPSPPATKLPQKQSQVSDALSSKRNAQISGNTRHSYKQLHLQTDKIFTVPENVQPDNTNRCATPAAAPEYKYYIQRILKRAGIVDKVTPLILGKWHTPSHPLDPSIFYYLELFHPTAASAHATSFLSRRCNRKLIFQLVDELLADILRTHLDFRPRVSLITDHSALFDELCKRIENFPEANCQVLEDIDSLIGKDFGECQSDGFLKDEGESMVREIEGEIMDSLLRETVAMVGVRTGNNGDRTRQMSRSDLHVPSFHWLVL